MVAMGEVTIRWRWRRCGGREEVTVVASALSAARLLCPEAAGMFLVSCNKTLTRRGLNSEDTSLVTFSEVET